MPETTPPSSGTAPQPEAQSNGAAKPPRRLKRWPIFIGLAFVAMLLFGGVGFVVASTLEEYDTFCISCHTVPETTYFNRAYIALDNPTLAVNDLSSAHYHLAQDGKKEPFGCIDCHRGDGSLPHRVATIALAARDTLTYVTGQENPAIGKTDIREGWLPNAACVSCHKDLLLNVKGLENHFHTLLPQAKDARAQGAPLTVSDVLKGKDEAVKTWSTPVENAPLTCTSCHLAHTTIPNGKAVFYMDAQRRNAACVSCHVAVGKGPQDAASLGN
jgi:predicted CXXCH cytochrome family protein